MLLKSKKAIEAIVIFIAIITVEVRIILIIIILPPPLLVQLIACLYNYNIASAIQILHSNNYYTAHISILLPAFDSC